MEAPPVPSANVGLRVGAVLGVAEVVAEAAVDPEVAVVVGVGDNHDWKDGTIEHWNSGNTQYSNIPSFLNATLDTRQLNF